MLTDAQKRANLRYKQSREGKIAQSRASARHSQTKKGKITAKKYQQSEKGKIVFARYRQSGKGKVVRARNKVKRKEEYGFEMINDWFKGCEGHHINKTNVLFIPSKLHRSISHSQDDLESMKRMNDAAFEWFYIEEVI